MLESRPIKPSAYSQYLATNHPKEADYVVRDGAGTVIAAKWHRPATHNAKQTAVAQHTLMYHIGGSTSVAKFVGARCIGTRAPHGSVTFSPRDESTQWIRGGVCEVMHVYIDPALLERYAAENLDGAGAPEIDPLFAVHDPWLQGYFRMLHSEFEIFAGDSKRPDGLLLAQSMELLLRHLVCWHSNLSRRGRRQTLRSAAPLAPRHLSRLLAYIDANLARDLSLDELAALVGISKYYLIRSFRAATQRTPYGYIVERRLARAVDGLKRSDASIEEIARAAGFKSAPGFSNVFKKHFGMSPSRFRTQAG